MGSLIYDLSNYVDLFPVTLGAIFYILCRVSYLSELVMIETLHLVHNNRLTWHVL